MFNTVANSFLMCSRIGRSVFYITSALALLACGGGGGDAGSTGTPNLVPIITLSFPITNAGQSVRFEGTEIDVTGTVVDPEGLPIERLEINGSDDPAKKVIVMGADIDSQGRWRAKDVELVKDENNRVQIKIKAIDTPPVQSSRVAESEITIDMDLDLSVPFNEPREMVLDSVQGRMLVVDGNRIIAVDLESGRRNVLSGDGVGVGPELINPGEMALDTVSNRVLVVFSDIPPFMGSALFGIISIDLVNGARTLLSGDHPDVISTRGIGPAFDEPVDIVFDASASNGGRALVVDSALEVVMAVALNTGNRSVLTGVDPDSLQLRGNGVEMLNFPRSITLGESDQALVVESSSRVFSIDLLTGNRELLSEGDPSFSRDAMAIEFDLDRNQLYVLINYVLFLGQKQRVSVLNLDTGNWSILSGGNGNGDLFGTGLKIENARGLILDAANNAAFISDDALKAIIKININNGDRVLASSASIGGGLLINTLDDLALNTASKRAFLLNSSFFGESSDSSVISIDTQNGRRTLLTGTHPEESRGEGPLLDTCLSFPGGIALDADNNRAFVAFADPIFCEGGKVLEVDLLNGERTEVSTFSSARLFNGIALDADNRRLLVTEIYGDPTVFSIELPGGETSVLSGYDFLQRETRGDGIGLRAAKDIVVDVTNNHNRALVADSALSALIEVNLNPGNQLGDRKIFSNADNGGLPAQFLPGQIAMDQENQRVLITASNTAGDNILAIDLLDGKSTLLSGFDVDQQESIGNGPQLIDLRGITLDLENGRALVSDKTHQAVIAVDIGWCDLPPMGCTQGSGDRVIISQ